MLKQGVHQFCFTKHFAPLLEQIAKLEEALFNIQFEQHWLEIETDHHAIVSCEYDPLKMTELNQR
ncbi:hypothetical protein GBA52_026964 [Prunus armeniaca]|nr:hypothetical protein GBA52_026964 [Prunus armeniaca]